MEPVLVPSGEGESITNTDRRSVAILCDLPEVTVTESLYTAGERGPDPHVHRLHADSFYVLEGSLVFGLGPNASEMLAAPAGTLVVAPANLVHTFGNDGPDDARFLNFHTPSGGFAEFLRTHEPWDSYDPPGDGGRPFADALVSGPGEPLEAGPSRLLFKAQDGNADGMLAVTESAIAPGFPGPPPHLHERFADCFYVLDGSLTLRLGEDSLDAQAGTFAAAPPGTVHTFGNQGPESARVLNVMAPGGFERFIKEVWDGGSMAAPDVVAEIASRYDFEPVS